MSIAVVPEDPRSRLLCGFPLTNHVHCHFDFSGFEDLSALGYHNVRIRKQGALSWNDLVLYLGEHGPESTRDALVSFGVNVSFMLAFDVLWVKGHIDDSAWNAIRELRNTPCDNSLDVERDRSNRDCFVTAWKSLREVSTREEFILTFAHLACKTSTQDQKAAR